MATFTMLSSGYHDAPIYDIVGVPVATDTVVNSNLSLSIKANVSASFDLQMAGTNDTTRAVFIVESGATYKQGFTAAVINDWSTINAYIDSTIDINGLAFEPIGGTVYGTRGTAVNQINLLGIANYPAKIISSVYGVGTFGSSGNWKQVFNYFAFKNTGAIRLEGGYYLGPELNIANGSLHITDEFFIGGYRDNAENWRLENVDIYGSTPNEFMGRFECRKAAATQPLTGTQICKNVTVHNTLYEEFGTKPRAANNNTGSAVIRFAGHEFVIDSFVFKDIIIEDVQYDGIEYKNCMLNGLAYNAKSGTSWVNNYSYTTYDNPHNFDQCMETFTDNVTENEYLDGYIDAGEAYIFPSGGFNGLRNMFIDHKTGVAFNMLHSSRSGIMNILHNTCVSYAQKLGGVYYGQLWRREGSGSKSGTGVLNIRSNLASNLNNTSLGAALFGAQTTPTISLVDVLSHNGLDGFETDYAEVDLTGLIANTDIIDEPANFYDPTRCFAKWNLNFGSGTDSGKDGVTHLLKMSGFNPATLQQDSSMAVSERPIDAVNWVRDGYRTGNVIYLNAGHDGVTIGAFEYLAAQQVSIGQKSSLSLGLGLTF